MATRFKIFIAAVLAMLAAVVLVQIYWTDKESIPTGSSDGGKVVAVPPLTDLQQERQTPMPLRQEHMVGQPANPVVEMDEVSPQIVVRRALSPPVTGIRRQSVLKGRSLSDRPSVIQPGPNIAGASRTLLTDEERRHQTLTAEIEAREVAAQRFRRHCRRVQCSWPYFNRPLRSTQPLRPSEETPRDLPAVQMAIVPFPEGAETSAQATGADRERQVAPIVKTTPKQGGLPEGGDARLATGLEFDTFRLSATGPTVIAGRGEPDCVITVLDGGQAIGEVKADRRGEWVLVRDEPLPPGSRELSLSQVCGEGLSLLSPHVVVLVVPEPGEDIAGRPTKQSAPPLAIEFERGGGGPAVVLQAPSPPVPTKKLVVGELAVVDDPLTPGGPVSAEAYDPLARQPAGRMPISLDAVNYTDEGHVVVAGRAPPGARLRVYLDNRAIGEAESDGDGRWSLTPVRPIAPGFYLLRVDQIDQKGAVVARVELPFLRAEPLTEIPDGTVAVVQPGNSLWRIARRVYGKGMQYAVIYEANAKQIRDPDLIYPGQIFILPRKY